MVPAIITLTLSESEARLVWNALYARRSAWRTKYIAAKLAADQKQEPDISPEVAKFTMDMIGDLEKKVKSQIEEQGVECI